MVDFEYREVDGGCIGFAVSVTDGIGEGVGSDIATIGRIGQGTAAIVGNGSVGCLSETGNAERITVDVAVIGQGRYDDRSVLVGACRIVSGDRWVIFRSDGDVDGRRVSSAVSITDGVVESVAAAVVAIWRVGQSAIAVVSHRAIRSLFERIDADGVSVDVVVIGEHRDDDGAVLVGGCRVIIGCGGVIHWRNGDVDGGRVGSAVSVTDVVVEGVTAVIVAVRHIGQSAIPVVGDRSIQSLFERIDADGVSIDVIVIGEHRDADGAVLVDRCRIVIGGGVVIHRRNGDVDSGGVGSAISVTDGVVESVAAVVVPIRRVGQTAITVIGDRSARALREGIDAERITVRVTVIVQDGNRNGRVF